jgi:hypothetical protein
VDKAITALIGALLGVPAIYFGLSFHVGTWHIDGPWAYVGSAISGALVACLVQYAVRKNYGLL